MAQGLSTPDPSLSLTHLSIRRGRATTTHYTHHQVSLMVSRNTTLVPSLGCALGQPVRHIDIKRLRPQRWHAKGACATPNKKEERERKNICGLLEEKTDMPSALRYVRRRSAKYNTNHVDGSETQRAYCMLFSNKYMFMLRKRLVVSPKRPKGNRGDGTQKRKKAGMEKKNPQISQRGCAYNYYSCGRHSSME